MLGRKTHQRCPWVTFLILMAIAVEAQGCSSGAIVDPDFEKSGEEYRIILNHLGLTDIQFVLGEAYVPWWPSDFEDKRRLHSDQEFLRVRPLPSNLLPEIPRIHFARGEVDPDEEEQCIGNQYILLLGLPAKSNDVGRKLVYVELWSDLQRSSGGFLFVFEDDLESGRCELIQWSTVWQTCS